MFNPSMQTKVSGKNNLGIFMVLALTITFSFAFFSKSTITGAVMMESGEAISYEPIFVIVAAIIILFLLSIIWWWLKKKRKN